MLQEEGPSCSKDAEASDHLWLFLHNLACPCFGLYTPAKVHPLQRQLTTQLLQNRNGYRRDNQHITYRLGVHNTRCEEPYLLALGDRWVHLHLRHTRVWNNRQRRRESLQENAYLQRDNILLRRRNRLDTRGRLAVGQRNQSLLPDMLRWPAITSPPMETVDVERCYSSDKTLTWLQSKKIHLTYKQETYVDW